MRDKMVRQPFTPAATADPELIRQAFALVDHFSPRHLSLAAASLRQRNAEWFYLTFPITAPELSSSARHRQTGPAK